MWLEKRSDLIVTLGAQILLHVTHTGCGENKGIFPPTEHIGAEGKSPP